MKACPLMLINRSRGNCIEKKCAWFVTPENHTEGECAISAIANELSFISNDIRDDLDMKQEAKMVAAMMTTDSCIGGVS